MKQPLTGRWWHARMPDGTFAVFHSENPEWHKLVAGFMTERYAVDYVAWQSNLALRNVQTPAGPREPQEPEDLPVEEKVFRKLAHHADERGFVQVPHISVAVACGCKMPEVRQAVGWLERNGRLLVSTPRRGPSPAIYQLLNKQDGA